MDCKSIMPRSAAILILAMAIWSGLAAGKLNCRSSASSECSPSHNEIDEQDYLVSYCLIGTNSQLNSWTSVPALAETPTMLAKRSSDGVAVVSHLMTSVSLELQPGVESVLAVVAEWDYDQLWPRIKQMSTYVYHTNLSSWFKVPGVQPSPARFGFSLVASADHRFVVLHGGFTNDPFSMSDNKGLQNDTWIFDLGTAHWYRGEVFTDIPGADVHSRAGHSAVILRDPDTNETCMAMFGGLTAAREQTADLLLLNLNTGAWTNVQQDGESPWPSPRYLHSAAATVDNTMLVFGAKSQSAIVKLDLWEFSLDTMRWEQLPDLDYTVIGDAGCNGDNFNTFFSPNAAFYYRNLDTLFVFPFKNGPIWLGSIPPVMLQYSPSPCSCYYNRSEVEARWRCVKMSVPDTLNDFLWLAGTSGEYGIYHFGFSYDLISPTEWMFDFSQSAKDVGLWQARFERYPSTSFSVPHHRVLSTAHYYGETGAVFMFGGLKLIDKSPFQSSDDPYDLDMAANDLWVYSTRRNTWSRVRLNGTPPSRYGHTAAVAHDRVLVIASGFHAFEVNQTGNVLWCFDLQALNWRSGPEVSRQMHNYLWRGYAILVYLPASNELILHGGYSPSNPFITAPYSDTWSFKFASTGLPDIVECRGSWKNLSCPNAPKLMGHTAVEYESSVIVFGGATFSGFISGYDLIAQNGTWRLLRTRSSCRWEEVATTKANNVHSQSNTLSPRMWHSSTVFGSQMVIAGGCVPVAVCEDIAYPLSCCRSDRISMEHVWVLDLVTWQWTYIGLRTPTALTTGMHTAVATGGNSMMLLDGLRDGSLVTADYNYRYDLMRQDFAVLLASPQGTATQSFSDANWTSCSTTSYADQIGSVSCSPCPERTNTKRPGAASLSSCRLCSSERICHGHGSCVVDEFFQPLCDCEFGYLSTDDCHLPLLFIYAGSGVVFIILIVVCIVLLRMYKKKNRGEAITHRRLVRSRSQVAQLNLAWQIDFTELVLNKRVDGDSPGAFGEVWLATYRDMPVAVKRLKAVQMEARSRLEFEREVSLMKTLRHPNIVMFLGAGLHEQQPFIVVEFMARGPLSSILRNHSIPVDVNQLIRWALDVAKGIHYLHNLTPPRIHRDLKTSNLLLSERWIVKVADFGTARLVRDISSRSPVAPDCDEDDFEDVGPYALSTSPCAANACAGSFDSESLALLHSTNSALMTRNAGTLLWCSPEVLAGKPYGASTDVYSFGIILWELCSRKIPFSEFPDFKWMSKISDGVEAGRRPTIPEDCHPDLKDLMQICWNSDPEQRPTFQEIAPRLESLLESVS